MSVVTRSLRVAASQEEVWNQIGSFQGLVNWHPAVESCALELIDGVEHRRLGLVGGGEILEKLLGSEDNAYGYSIVTGPLPVSDYRSILTVAPAGDHAIVVWSSTFVPAGPDAEAAIGGVYDAGLSALAEHFSG